MFSFILRVKIYYYCGIVDVFACIFGDTRTQERSGKAWKNIKVICKTM